MQPLKPLAGQALVVKTDRLSLFAGTSGLLTGFGPSEAVGSLDGGGRLLAEAGPAGGKPVIAAYRLGRGLVIRTGLPEWRARLAEDPEVDAVTRRAWNLLSR